MTSAGAIGAAQEALSRNDRACAVRPYEFAGRQLAEIDQERTAHLYGLAMTYASDDYVRQDQLAAEAPGLLEMVDGKDKQIADVLLARERTLRSNPGRSPGLSYSSCSA
jgi:hypothetical protein